MQSVAKASLRIGRNALGGYSDNANRARDATSSDQHPPSHAQLVELSESTFNDNDRAEIIAILDKRLGAKGKLWAQTYKSLIVVVHCLLFGATRFVRHYQQNIHLIKTLREFQHIDDAGTDQGANVRERARYITALLQDEERLTYERKHGEGSWDPSRHAAPKPASPVRSRAPPPKQPQVDHRKVEQDSDRELEEALRISREEEERRQRELKAQKEASLFDDVANKEKDLLDFSSSNQTAIDSYAAQQAQQAQQLEYMRQQQMMQMQAQADAQAQYMAQQAYLQQQQAYEQQAAYAQQQQYLMWQQQQQQAYAQQQAQMAQQYQPQVAPQPTGNPFAAFAPAPQSSPQPPPPQPAQPAQPQNSLSAHQAQQQSQQRTGRHAELENILAAGPGVDTFGNYGNMRFGQSGQRTGR